MEKMFILLKVCLTYIVLILSTYQVAFSQLGRCKGKYFGNIVANSVPSNYTGLWNQVTSENGSKWGSIEGTRGVYNWTSSDIGYNWAKNNGGLYKFHTLVWGAQTPNWVNTASVATIQTAVMQLVEATAAHYNPLGGLKMIDVLNEPVNTQMVANYKAALTAGYRAEPTNAGDLNNPYGWAIWCFQLARKSFPTATLLINEYNVEMNWNNCRTPYIAMIKAIKNAPNLTDGSRNLIDGVGLQAHGIENLTAANFNACIDEIWNNTGLPIHITEFDTPANPNETKQRNVFSSLLPVAWEHPRVAGITFWGYIQGQTWISGNRVTGSGGTDSGIMYADGTDRPAMSWLRSYMSGIPSLACCPAPAPFASCPTTSRSFVTRARATASGGQLQLVINNTVIATYYLTTSFTNYSTTSTDTGTVRLQVANDTSTRDVEVDYLQVNGNTLQAESQPINTAFYSNGRCGGGGYSQMMNCNGYIEFTSYEAPLATELEVETEVLDKNSVIVYPNPVSDSKLNIQFYNEIKQNIDIELLSFTGVILRKTSKSTLPQGTHSITFDVSSLLPNTYLVSVKKENGILITQKIIVSR
ncbi:MAG: endo-1,4-beta-xylanase [Flectobacillus sp.]|nr:endo-1,4-beta-xylanase [Flectobacillus sp.]